jgi:hypothetical protein
LSYYFGRSPNVRTEVRSSAGTHTELNAVVLTAYELVKEPNNEDKKSPALSFLPQSQLQQNEIKQSRKECRLLLHQLVTPRHVGRKSVYTRPVRQCQDIQAFFFVFFMIA